MRKRENMIIYQLAPRTFTPEGTINAAKDLLPHIASLGVDIVYLCPVWVAENDSDKSTWSERQRASGTDNPKNPYKMADYYNVDDEYGTNEDLKSFVEEAHNNGLLVLFDLVYLHCGKSAVFIDEHPDFVIRNEDGSVFIAKEWPFARLNFDNPELRIYLRDNMEMFITEFGADGFRCDVGDYIPLDFWRESFDYLKKIKPDLITLNEGRKAEYLDGVFDFSYNIAWNVLMLDIFCRDKLASELEQRYNEEKEIYGDNVKRLLRTIDSHDIASDCVLNRNEIDMTSRGVEAALVITNTFDGVSFLWNGYEVCDRAENCMFSNRFFGRRSASDWSRAFTADGVRRREFINKIHSVHHNCDAIVNGKMRWIKNSSPDEVAVYVKESDSQKILVAVNCKNKKITASLSERFLIKDILMSYGMDVCEDNLQIEPYGFIIAEIQC